MSLERLASKYINCAQHVFREMTVTKIHVNMDVDNVRKVVDWAKAYLEDAKYYSEKKKFEVSLTSVAYCEGLLDALRLLGAVRFEWPRKVKEGRRAR